MPAKISKESSTASKLTISSIPDSERPRERCLKFGAKVLSLRECLAVIFGTGPRHIGCLGLADQILTCFGQLPSDADKERAFFAYIFSEERPFHPHRMTGLGPANLAKLLATIELIKRFGRFVDGRHDTESAILSDRVDENACLLFKTIPDEYLHARYEWVGFVPVSSGGHFGELCVVQKGSLTRVSFSPSDFFLNVLVRKPVAFYLLHNHPSGLHAPSEDDLALTAEIKTTSDLLGLYFGGHYLVCNKHLTRIQ